MDSAKQYLFDYPSDWTLVEILILKISFIFIQFFCSNQYNTIVLTLINSILIYAFFKPIFFITLVTETEEFIHCSNFKQWQSHSRKFPVNNVGSNALLLHLNVFLKNPADCISNIIGGISVPDYIKFIAHGNKLNTESIHSFAGMLENGSVDDVWKKG